MSAKVVPLRKGETDRNATSGRLPNNVYRIREHLTEGEIDKLLAALKRNRHAHRDWLRASREPPEGSTSWNDLAGDQDLRKFVRSTNSPCTPDECHHLATARSRLRRVAAVFDRISISLRSPRRWAAVHPTTAILHRRRLARRAPTCPARHRSAWCISNSMALFPPFQSTPSQGMDIPDNGLSASVYVHMLNTHRLCAAALKLRQRLDLGRVCTQEFYCE
jgi:hypothetical protein